MPAKLQSCIYKTLIHYQLRHLVKVFSNEPKILNSIEEAKFNTILGFQPSTVSLVLWAKIA